MSLFFFSISVELESDNVCLWFCLFACIWPTNFGALWGIHQWSDFFSWKGKIPSSILLFIMFFWSMVWPWNFQELFIMYWESCSEDLSKFLLLIQFLWPYKVKSFSKNFYSFSAVFKIQFKKIFFSLFSSHAKFYKLSEYI